MRSAIFHNLRVVLVVSLLNLVLYWSLFVRSSPRRLTFKQFRARYDADSGVDAEWQTVADGELYVYSAHMDVRDVRAQIVFFGLIRTNLTLDLTCQLWNRHRQIKAVKGHLIVREIKKAYLFSSMEINCFFPLSPWAIKHTSTVSLTARNATTGTQRRNSLLINRDFRPTDRRDFTVCLWSPARKLNNSLRLLEWIELNRMYGAQKFVIYNHSVSSLLDPVLEYYSRHDIVQIHQWSLPRDINPMMVVNYGQMAMISDCHFRNLHSSRYVVGVDLDEVVVPRSGRTWPDVLDKSGCPPLTSVFHMLHLYYGTEGRLWPDDPRCRHHDMSCSADQACGVDTLASLDWSNTYLGTMCKTYRHPTVLRQSVRSKYIASPLLTWRMRVHGALTRISECTLGPGVAALHHYRGGLDVLEAELNATHIRDPAILRYEHILRERLMTVARKLLSERSHSGR